MSTSRAGRSTNKHPGRHPVKVLIAVVVSALVLGACGGGTDRPATVPTSATEEPTVSTSTTSADLAPAEVGDLIGALYQEAIEEVVARLEDRPQGPPARTMLEEMKEGYIQEFVVLGRLREAFDPAGRAAVDARIRAALNAMSADLFAEYQALVDDYRATDNEMAELIASFNIITQYASFDLLREQAPDEAARLLGG